MSNIKKMVLPLLFVLCLVGLTYSATAIIMWKLDCNKTNDQLDSISRTVEDNGDIDFVKLKQINADAKGWLKLEGTNIDYPFVQAKDNDFYLTHSFDKSRNQAGWIFLDYRINLDFLNKNTIIYGHDRKDKTMFGSLNDLAKNDWYNNKNNHVVKMSTEKEDTLWQIFSVYHIRTTDDYLQTSFVTSESYQSFLDLIKKRSILKFDTDLNSNDRILTLSTCYTKNEKTVLHAKLIENEQKINSYP